MTTPDPPLRLQPPATRRHPWLQLGLVLLVFLVSREWILLMLEPQLPDTIYYAELARKNVDCQMVPYRDYIIEYPPLAWWLMKIPKLLDSKSYPVLEISFEDAQEYKDWYFGWFHFQMYLIDAFCLVLIFFIGRSISPRAEWGLPAAYTLVTLAQPYLQFDRLDVGLLLFFLLWIYCDLRSLQGSAAAEVWALAGYFFLGLGFSYKITPLVCFPLVWLADLRASRSFWRPLALAAAFIVPAVGPFLIQIRISGPAPLGVFGFHAARGIQMESVWASVMLVARALGAPVDTLHTDTGYDLTGPWHDTLKTVASLTQFAAALLLGLWALWRGKRFDRRTAQDAAYLAVINSVVLSHVYSPQYLIWWVPLALLLAIDVLPARRIVWCVLVGLIAVIVGTSGWLFPLRFAEMVTLEETAVVLMVVRSACLLALGVILNFAFFRRRARFATAGAES